MRLATYRNLSSGSSGDRLGLVLSDGKIADLRLCYAGYLKTQKEPRPYPVANALIPRDMREFLCGEKKSLEVASLSLKYAEEESAKNKDVLGPEKENCIIDSNMVRLRPPIPRPGKFLHTGLNSNKHVENTGNKVPANVPGAPRFSSTLIGHEDPVLYPKQTQKLDYEVEVAFIIGTTCKDVPPENAFDVIMGYTVYNDITAREVQKSDALGGVFLGKNFDTTNPIGPYIVTADKVPNPESLHVECRVNGEIRQDERLTDMIFKIPDLISFYSQMTLEPGDMISSGTFCGVAHEHEDPSPYFLKPGDVVECEVEHIGILRNEIKSQE